MTTNGPKGMLLARTAAAMCKLEEFRLWLDRMRKLEAGTHQEKCARDFICDACKVPGRNYLDHDEYAAKMFYKILTQYDEYVQSKQSKIVQKNEEIILKKVKAGAKGAPCQRCHVENGTTVACHYQGPRSHIYGKGKGRKPWDIAVAYLCMKCHALMDSYLNDQDQWTRSEEFQHYIIMTWAYIIRAGILDT